VGTLAFLVSPRGLERGWAPYAGGGAAIIGGLSRDWSWVMLAGVMKPRSHGTPLLELQYHGRGASRSRLSVTLGLLL